MPLHESYSDPPRILHFGENERIDTHGVVERRTSPTTVAERLDAIDCLVCEHAPPEYDALAVLERVRDCDRSVPVLIVTDDDRTVTDALSAGVTDCVVPGNRELLAHRIDRVVDRYRDERALSQATAILRGLSTPVVAIDEHGEIRYANDDLERMLGYDPSEIVGDPLTRAIPERLHSAFEDSFERYVETNERRLDWEGVETIARHRDGREVPVTLSLRRATCDGEAFFTGIIRDASERKAVESELEASRKRYRKLITTSPEAILVADAETGEIIDTNSAAEELFGRPRNEICGMHQSELHPAERRENYRRMFDERAKEGGITRNADHITVVRPDGEEIPVEISSTVIQFGDRRVVYGIFKNISERKTRERTLESLRSATRELMTAETKSEICEIAVEAAGKELGIPLSGIFLTNDGGDVLQPVAVTETTEQLLDEVPSFETGQALAWSVFESGEATMFEDVKNEPGVYNRETEIEQEMIIPLASHGVFMLGSLTTSVFDEYVRDFAKILATNVQAALDRAEREETLTAQRAELSELNRINEVIRDVDRTLVQATNREEIENTVVNRLASAGPYEFAWVGEDDMSDETVRTVADAGDSTYIESVRKADDTRDCPVANVLSSERAIVVEEVATDPSFENESQSIAAIPIRYDETCYGVLVVHADRAGAFDDRERAVLVELGETVGLAIAAMERRNALVSDTVVEVEMVIPEADHYFIHVPQELGCSFTLLGTTMASNGAIHCFITTSGAPLDEVLEAVAEFEGITDTRIVHERDDESIFEVTYQGPSFVKMLVDRGATMGDVEANGERARGTVEMPVEADVRGTVEAVKNLAPSGRVVAQREREKPERTTPEYRMEFFDSLTDRQRTALKTAYFAGFFDWPRTNTGEEVAELLDVSAPTFHQHLRHAQSKLLETFFE